MLGEVGVAKARAAISQVGRILNRLDDIAMRTMIELEGTEWYLTFQAETKGHLDDENEAEAGAGAGREIEIMRGITDAGAQGHRLLRMRRTEGEAEAEIEIGAHGTEGAMSVTDSHFWVCLWNWMLLMWVICVAVLCVFASSVS